MMALVLSRNTHVIPWCIRTVRTWPVASWGSLRFATINCKLIVNRFVIIIIQSSNQLCLIMICGELKGDLGFIFSSVHFFFRTVAYRELGWVRLKTLRLQYYIKPKFGNKTTKYFNLPLIWIFSINLTIGNFLEVKFIVFFSILIEGVTLYGYFVIHWFLACAFFLITLVNKKK